MNDHPQQDYFEQVEQGLRDAIRRGAHRRGRSGWWRLARASRGGSSHPAALRSTSNARPRSRLRAGFAFATGACILAAAIVLLTVGLGTGTQQAFAGWTPTPTTPAKGQRAAAEASCRSRLPRKPRLLQLLRLRGRLGELERRAIARERAHARLLRDSARARRWRTVLVDTRGPYTVVMLARSGLARSGEQASCFIGPAPSTRAISVGVAGGMPEPPPAIGPGQIGDLSFGGMRVAPKANASFYTEASGRTGAGVSGVTLVLEGGSHVRATTAKGWFVAWWPGERQAIAAEVSTATGTTKRHLYNPLAHPRRKASS